MKNKTPKINSHFYNIESEILALINNAKSAVYVASGWFTNETLFEKLISLCKKGIHVEILISDSDEAINSTISNNVDRLKNSGGNIFSVSISSSASLHAIMHNKFCIIDEQIVITGSYNWTNNANYSKENIIVIRDENIANEYLQNFISLRALGTSLDESYDDIEIYFTSTKKYVGVGMDFQLHWDIRNATIVTLNGETVSNVDSRSEKINSLYHLKDYKGSKDEIEEDSGVIKEKIYELVAENYTSTSRKAITIKVLEKPIIEYKITVKVNGVEEKRAKLKIEDSYIAPIGSEITLEWNIKYAEDRYLDAESINSKGYQILYPSGSEIFKISAENKLFRTAKAITIHMIEIPRLEKVSLPFPEIKTNLNVDLNRSNIPASFSLTEIKNKIQLPEIQSLNLAIKDSSQSLNYLNKTILAKTTALKNQIKNK